VGEYFSEAERLLKETQVIMQADPISQVGGDI
jgi:hypothetical protein